MINNFHLRYICYCIPCLFVFCTARTNIAGPLPDTGQTISHTNTFGEDSDYTINPPSYTKLAQNGVELPDTATQAEGWIMTRDNVTRLIWEIKTDDGSAHDKDNSYSWYDPNPYTNGGNPGTPGDGTDTQDFLDALNSSSFGGFSDWRLPTIKELASIVHYDYYDPAIDMDYFPNTITAYEGQLMTTHYWSSTPGYSTEGIGYYTNFFSGEIYGQGDIDLADHQPARAVRGEQIQTIYQSAFIDNGDGTITDRITGLMWQKQDDGTPRTRESALKYCEALSLAGYDDWRLPNIRELTSIMDYSKERPAMQTVFFPATGTNQGFLSSTVYAGNTNRHWAIYTTFGISSFDQAYLHSRAVRGGQIRLPGHLIISNPNQGEALTLGETCPIQWETRDIPGNVTITLSRDGGKTFPEKLSASTPNNGSFQWVTKGPASHNCALKIAPLDDVDMATIQGFFTIEAADYDTDGDGLLDTLEETLCTDPDDADSDDDGIPDAVEYRGETDPCNSDTDGDGIQDGTERGFTLKDIGADTNIDFYIPDSDNDTVTDPMNSDSDDDNIIDGVEDENHNGKLDLGETDPLVFDENNNSNPDESGSGGGCFISIIF